MQLRTYSDNSFSTKGFFRFFPVFFAVSQIVINPILKIFF